jgi:adenylate kinase
VDDGIEIVRERLKVYQRQTKPLVEYYATRRSFSSIDGNRPPDVVTAAVDAALDAALDGASRGVTL